MLSGHVSANYVHLLYDWLAEQGQDPAQVLGKPRPVAGELNRIPITEWRALLEKAQALYNEPGLSLKIGARIHPRNTGLLGYMAACCTTLGEALARLQRFEQLVYAVNSMGLQVHADQVTLVWDRENGLPGPLVDEVAIASLIAFVRGLTGSDMHPTRVTFINPAPADLKPYTDFFKCPVEFAQKRTEVIFPIAWMEWRLPQPDALLRATLDKEAERLLSEVSHADEPLKGFRMALTDSILAGSPTVQDVGRRLAMSSRTLQRRLQEAGTGFQHELDKVRFSMSKHYLKQTSMPLSEVAMMLGYSEQSAFNHAFTRWQGRTPLSFRKRG